MSEKSPPEVFVDGIGAYRFSGGVIRIDLVSATEALDHKDVKDTVVTQRVIMPLEAFIRTVGSLNDMAKQLVEAGVIKSRGNEGQVGDTSENGKAAE